MIGRADAARRVRLRRVRRRLALPAFLLMAAGAVTSTAACGRRSPGAAADVSLTLTPATPVVGPAMLSITVRSRAGGSSAQVSGATVRLEGHMTHAGMAPVLAGATERAPGTYEIPFTFTMPGDWALLVSMEWPDGTRVERRLDVANVRLSR